jgi:chromosome segregation ATPase
MVSQNDPAATPTPDGVQDTPQEVAQTGDASADVEKLNAQVKKLESDLRAANGRTRNRRSRSDESDNLLLSTNNEVRMLNRRVDTLMNAIGTGDTDGLPDAVSQLNAQQAQSVADLDYQQQWEGLSDDLVAAVKNADNEDIINVHTAPELEQVRQDWTAAHQRRDIAGLARAVAETQRVARGLEREGRSPASQAQNNGNTRAFELDTGPSVGGSGMSDERWLDTVYGAENYSPTKADHARAKIALDRIAAGG